MSRSLIEGSLFSFSSDKSYFAICDSENVLRVYDTDKNQFHFKITICNSLSFSKYYSAEKLTSLCWGQKLDGSDARYLYIAKKSGIVEVDLKRKKVSNDFNITRKVSSMSYNEKEGGILYSSFSNDYLSLLNLKNRKVSNKLYINNTEEDHIIKFIEDKDLILIGTSNLTLWHLGSKRKIAEYRSQPGQITCIAVSPDNKFALSTSVSQTSISIWDIENPLIYNMALASLNMDSRPIHIETGSLNRYKQANVSKCSFAVLAISKASMVYVWVCTPKADKKFEITPWVAINMDYMGKYAVQGIPYFLLSATFLPNTAFSCSLLVAKQFGYVITFERVFLPSPGKDPIIVTLNEQKTIKYPEPKVPIEPVHRRDFHNGIFINNFINNSARIVPGANTTQNGNLVTVSETMANGNRAYERGKEKEGNRRLSIADCHVEVEMVLTNGRASKDNQKKSKAKESDDVNVQEERIQETATGTISQELNNDIQNGPKSVIAEYGDMNDDGSATAIGEMENLLTQIGEDTKKNKKHKKKKKQKEDKQEEEGNSLEDELKLVKKKIMNHEFPGIPKMNRPDKHSVKEICDYIEKIPKANYFMFKPLLRIKEKFVIKDICEQISNEAFKKLIFFLNIETKMENLTMKQVLVWYEFLHQRRRNNIDFETKEITQAYDVVNGSIEHSLDIIEFLGMVEEIEDKLRNLVDGSGFSKRLKSDKKYMSNDADFGEIEDLESMDLSSNDAVTDDDESEREN